MLLKDHQVTDAILDKLRSNQRPTVMPLLPIRGEDTVSQEVLPFFMEGLTFAIVFELSRQDGFDILRIGSEDKALRTELCFDSVWRRRGPESGEQVLPEFEVSVADSGSDAFVDKIEACRGYQWESEDDESRSYLAADIWLLWVHGLQALEFHDVLYLDV